MLSRRGMARACAVNPVDSIAPSVARLSGRNIFYLYRLHELELIVILQKDKN